MLDDLKYIHSKDQADALGIAEKQWQQLTHVYDFSLQLKANVENVVFAGMGGSALSAQISLSWPGYSVPFEICRQYDIPAYVGSNTLFIASSYSGNTEETITALEQAEQKGAQIVIIASGGKLKQIGEAKNYPVVLLPPAGQPRFGVFYGLKALVTILQKANLVDDQTVTKFSAAAQFLQKSSQAWLPTVPASQNLAKKLAQECMGRSPVIYAGPKMYPAAYKWKISFNESAKNIAWCNQLPEFNHNEFIGWSSHPVDKPYTVIDLRCSLEHPRVVKRFEVTERLLSGRRPPAQIINTEGNNLLEHLLWATTLGDFTSLYLGLLNGLDPTPVDLIEKFKQDLAD